MAGPCARLPPPAANPGGHLGSAGAAPTFLTCSHFNPCRSTKQSGPGTLSPTSEGMAAGAVYLSGRGKGGEGDRDPAAGSLAPCSASPEAQRCSVHLQVWVALSSRLPAIGFLGSNHFGIKKARFLV